MKISPWRLAEVSDSADCLERQQDSERAGVHCIHQGQDSTTSWRPLQAVLLLSLLGTLADCEGNTYISSKPCPKSNRSRPLELLLPWLWTSTTLQAPIGTTLTIEKDFASWCLGGPRVSKPNSSIPVLRKSKEKCEHISLTLCCVCV